jgi:hypothetical protein
VAHTPCARYSVCADCGGGLSPTPDANASTCDRGLGLAIGLSRIRVWRTRSPSADPCIATRLRTEGPGSSNAEGVLTSVLVLLLIHNVDDSCP